MPGFMARIHVFFCDWYRNQGVDGPDIRRKDAPLPAMTVFDQSSALITHSETGADIQRSHRYINPARQRVRAFVV